MEVAPIKFLPGDHSREVGFDTTKRKTVSLLSGSRILTCCAVRAASPKAPTPDLIQDYLGHRNIQHTVRYMTSNPARFQRLWQ